MIRILIGMAHLCLVAAVGVMCWILVGSIYGTQVIGGPFLSGALSIVVFCWLAWLLVAIVNFVRRRLLGRQGQTKETTEVGFVSIAIAYVLASAVFMFALDTGHFALATGDDPWIVTNFDTSYITAAVSASIIILFFHWLIGRRRASLIFVVVSFTFAGLATPLFWSAWDWVQGYTQAQTLVSEKRALFSAVDKEVSSGDRLTGVRSKIDRLEGNILGMQGDTFASSFIGISSSDRHLRFLNELGLVNFVTLRPPQPDIVQLVRDRPSEVRIWASALSDHDRANRHPFQGVPQTLDADARILSGMAVQLADLLDEEAVIVSSRITAQAAFSLAELDYELLKESHYFPPAIAHFFWLLIAIFPIAAFVHVMSIPFSTTGYALAITRRVLGYFLLFYAIFPFVLLACLVIAVTSFGARVSIPLKQIQTDVVYFAHEARHDAVLVRNFIANEEDHVVAAVGQFLELEKKIEGELLSEFQTLRKELTTDIDVLKNAASDIEEAATKEIKDAVSSVTSKVTDMFSFHVPIIGDIDLGIGSFLSGLIPNFDLGEIFEKFGQKFLHAFEEPFQAPLQRIKAIEQDIAQKVREEEAAVERLIAADVVTIRIEIAELQEELSRSLDVYRADVRRLVEESGEILLHVLWFLNVFAIIAVLVILFVFSSMVVNFVVRFHRSLSMIWQKKADAE